MGTKNSDQSIDWEGAAVMFQHEQYTSAHGRILPLASDILRVLATAGKIGLIIAFPKAASNIAPLLIGDQSYKRWATKKVLTQLNRQKFVSIEYQDDGNVKVKITKKGMVKAISYKLNTMKIASVRWDKKWRMVIFDIPNSEKKIRDQFRLRLKQLPMYQFQESVFVSPYPCFDEIEFLRHLYRVSIHVEYLLVEKIEHDEKLRLFFDIEE